MLPELGRILNHEKSAPWCSRDEEGRNLDSLSSPPWSQLQSGGCAGLHHCRALCPQLALGAGSGGQRGLKRGALLGPLTEAWSWVRTSHSANGDPMAGKVHLAMRSAGLGPHPPGQPCTSLPAAPSQSSQCLVQVGLGQGPGRAPQETLGSRRDATHKQARF